MYLSNLFHVSGDDDKISVGKTDHNITIAVPRPPIQPQIQKPSHCKQQSDQLVMNLSTVLVLNITF